MTIFLSNSWSLNIFSSGRPYRIMFWGIHLRENTYWLLNNCKWFGENKSINSGENFAIRNSLFTLLANTNINHSYWSGVRFVKNIIKIAVNWRIILRYFSVVIMDVSYKTYIYLSITNIMLDVWNFNSSLLASASKWNYNSFAFILSYWTWCIVYSRVGSFPLNPD